MTLLKCLMCKFLKSIQFYFYCKKNNIKISYKVKLRNISLEKNAVIDPYCRIIGSKKIKIGKNFYANAHCHFLGDIEIGDNVQIGPKVVIWSRDHGIRKDQLIRKQDHFNNKIIIEDDVWIGASAVILKGVTLHNGCVIGAGSVVTKNIPENAIAVGNPAKVVKYRE